MTERKSRATCGSCGQGPDAMVHGSGRGKHLFLKRRSGPQGLPTQEKQRRDRESWAKSRAKTGNWSSRAYNLAIQDAARWVREERPSLWEDFYQARCEEQRARVEHGRVVDCLHEVVEQVDTVEHAYQCCECKALVGVGPVGAAPRNYNVFSTDGGRVRFIRAEGLADAG